MLLLAALLLTAVAAGAGTVPGDIALARAIQQPVSPEVDAAARFVSFIGDEFPAMAILALVGVAMLVSLGRWDLALFLAVAAGLRALGPGLKVLVNSPRPSLEDVAIAAQADGLGFPSGHALGAALFYGAIAVIAPHVVRNQMLARGIQLATVAMMILIALSRVRLGVHWPTDVAGGLLLGIALICFLQAGMSAWDKRSKRQ